MVRLISTSPLGPFSKITVLVVDDSRAQRALVAGYLKKWGFSVREAATGLQALEICKAQRVDMVLCDWMMPEMDGLEFCEAFRALERKNYGYFILLTSKSEKKDVAEGLDTGADDFLSKPVNSVELRARLNAGLRLLDMEDQLIRQNKKTEKALGELQQLYETIDRDLVEAGKLQQSLIPVRDRQLSNGRVSLHLKSARHVGGDLVGFIRFSDDRLGIYSIDVSGHGVCSALLAARLAGHMNGHNKSQNVAFERMSDGTYRHRSPEQVATVLNERMLAELDTDLYVTLAFADINLTTGQVFLTQAGHPNPVVLSAGGEVTYHGCGGLPVGLIEGAVFDRTEFRLDPGDRLMLFTDGITECENPDGKILDEDGLQNLLRKHRSSKGLAMLDALFADLYTYAEKDELDDDISAIVFEFGTSGASAKPVQSRKT